MTEPTAQPPADRDTLCKCSATKLSMTVVHKKLILTEDYLKAIPESSSFFKILRLLSLSSSSATPACTMLGDRHVP